MEWLASPEVWVAFFTLTALEILLGIDNIVFISILVGRLPKEQQSRARLSGLALAMGTRILLLLSIAWVMRLTHELFTLFGRGLSGRDLILFCGGLFLLFKSTLEIWHSLEGDAQEGHRTVVRGGLVGAVLQIALIDIVLSLDSVITAVGLVQNVPVMIAAIVAAVLAMMAASGAIGDFIERHPSLKVLALSFLILVGTLLVAESFGVQVPKGYVYFAMAFSLAVESLNIRMRLAMKRKLNPPVKLYKDLPDYRRSQ